jgi:hypothetical protein
MNRAHFGICVGGEESKKLMFTLDGVCFGAAPAMPCSPDARENRKRPVLMERKPGWRLSRLSVGVFAK